MKVTEGSIFEKTYDLYLDQIRQVERGILEKRLGVIVEGNEIVVPLFGRHYRVSDRDILDPSGKRPPLDVCVILCKYILMCPDESHAGQDWITLDAESLAMLGRNLCLMLQKEAKSIFPAS